MVRLFSLRDGQRADLRPALLPKIRSADRRDGFLQHVRGRFRLPAYLRHSLRPLWRPDRGQVHADRHAAGDACGDGVARTASDLWPDRDLGAGALDRVADRPAIRGRRRMGWRRANGGGAFTEGQARLLRKLAAGRSPGRTAALDWRLRSDLEPAGRYSLLVGMACRVSIEHSACRRRVVYQAGDD